MEEIVFVTHNKGKIESIIELFEKNGFSNDLIKKLEEFIPKY